MEEIAVDVKNVSKNFSLPHDRANSIKEAFVNPFRSSMHKNVQVQHALKNVSLQVKQGEFFGIVGRNGSGKSTLLKMLAGIYQPTKGTIGVKGKLVPFIELGVGFNPELTGKENVYLNGALLGFSEREIAAKYDDIVEFAELKDFMDQKLKNYSSGMQVRLAFSMAVRAEADILLIDEVLAVGDADFQRKCFEYFNQLKKTKKTVVFVSHDMDAVQRYCDRAMLIEKNQVVQIGDVHEVAKKYTRLFTSQSAGGEQAGSDLRWGDGKLKTDLVTIHVDKNRLSVKQRIVAKQHVEGVTAGIRIRSSSGQPITGTNSQLENQKPQDMKKGEMIELTWQVPNIFSDGQYDVDLVAAYTDGSVVADWWDEAGNFTIKKPRVLPYPVDPSIQLTVKKVTK